MLPNPTKETVLEVIDSGILFFDHFAHIKEKAPAIGKIIESDTGFNVLIQEKIMNNTASDEEKIKLLSIALSQGTLIYLALEAQDKKNASQSD